MRFEFCPEVVIGTILVLWGLSIIIKGTYWIRYSCHQAIISIIPHLCWLEHAFWTRVEIVLQANGL